MHLPEIKDPNDAPYLPAPRGQLSQRPPPEAQIIARKPWPQRRVTLTLAPTFARLKQPMIGRRAPFSGVGWHLEAEVALVEWLTVHAGWQRAYFGVPATGELEAKGNKNRPTAARGWLRWQDFSAGLRYIIDSGHLLPHIEAGAALAGLQSPGGIQEGQSGQKCAPDKRCDSGLVCNTQSKTCEAKLTPLAFVGVGAEYLIGRYFGVGALLRYYLATTSGVAQMNFSPLQWNFQLRLSARY